MSASITSSSAARRSSAASASPSGADSGGSGAAAAARAAPGGAARRQRLPERRGLRRLERSRLGEAVAERGAAEGFGGELGLELGGVPVVLGGEGEGTQPL